MRRVADILKHPKTDEEERLAAEHIRAECERIQAGWLVRERAKREGVESRRVLFREFSASELIGARRRA